MFKFIQGKIFNEMIDLLITVSIQLQFSDLDINRVKKLRDKPEDCDKVSFGSVFSDHMLRIDWDINSGWSKPHIKGVENFSLHPSCTVFHYAAEVLNKIILQVIIVLIFLRYLKD